MNFVIPQGFDFYKELENNIHNSNEKKNTCLIDGTSLGESHITLECGHKFNYIPLLNDVYEEKYNRSKNSYYYSYSYRRLSDNQLRCPYCRKIQEKILPYFPELYQKKLRGVNYPIALSMGDNHCSHVFKTGKNKGTVCGKKCFREKCHQHHKTEKDYSTVERTEESLRKFNVHELKKIAKHHKIKGFSKLKKNELINKIIDI